MSQLRKFFLLLLFLHSYYFISAQQSVLEKRISISYTNTELHAILEEIEKQGNFNFSFNSLLFDKNQTVSISVTNEKIIAILRELITDKTLVYREHGDQVVIYKPRKGDVKGKPIHINPVINQDKEKLKIVCDTIYEYQLLTDTLYFEHIDTMLVYDTVPVYDTVKIHSPIINSQADKKLTISWGPSVGVCISDIQYQNTVSRMSAVVDALNASHEYTRSLALGANLYFGEKLKTNVGLGVFLEREPMNLLMQNENLQYSYTQYDSSYTVSWAGSYYEYLDGDTILHDVYDSVLNITETEVWDTLQEDIALHNTNSFFYLSLPLISSFPIYNSKKIEFNLNVGIIGKILLFAHGNIIVFSEGQYSIQKLDRTVLNSFLADLYLAPSMTFQLTEGLSLKGDCSFFYGLRSIYKASELYERNAMHFGISIAFIKKI